MREGLKFDYTNKVCEGDAFEGLVDDVARYLPANVLRQTVYDSISHLAGEKLTDAVIRDTCWRLAGNTRLLARRDAVPPWNSQRFDEWVPVQVIRARPAKGRRPRDKGWSFSFQILGGTSCTLVMTTFWTNRLAAFISKRLGFTSRMPSPKSSIPPTRRFRDGRELVTLRMLALIEKEKSDREPAFEKVEISPSLLEWNKKQLKYRDRFGKDYACPNNYPIALPCFRCHIGYENCRAGTHRYDYEFDYCDTCGEDKQAFDEELSTDMCINCYHRRVFTRRD